MRQLKLTLVRHSNIDPIKWMELILSYLVPNHGHSHPPAITLTNAAAFYFYIVNLSNFDFAAWEQILRTVPYALRYKLSNAQELMQPLHPPRPPWQIQHKLNLGFRPSRGFLA